jgi:hypothetical protein
LVFRVIFGGLYCGRGGPFRLDCQIQSNNIVFSLRRSIVGSRGNHGKRHINVGFENSSEFQSSSSRSIFTAVGTVRSLLILPQRKSFAVRLIWTNFRTPPNLVQFAADQ